MKIKISESQIRQVVNEEVLKNALKKSIKETKFPNYAAHLLAEILVLEYSATTEETKKEMVEKHGMDEETFAEWVNENADAYGLPEEDVAEAKAILGEKDQSGGGGIGASIGGFFKKAAAPLINLHKIITNVTQQGVYDTEPQKKAAAVAQKVAAKMPDEEEMKAAAKQAEDPADFEAYLRKIIDLLQGVDDSMDLDQLKPGLEAGGDKVIQGVDAALDDAPGEAGGAGEAEAEGGGKEAFVFKGKGGKGLQSFLARASNKGQLQVPLKGKAMGAVLKHIAKQLKAQGVTVNEAVLDEIQGWAWYGLVENEMQKHYGQPITIQEVLEGLGNLHSNPDKAKRSKKAGSLARDARMDRMQKLGLDAFDSKTGKFSKKGYDRIMASGDKEAIRRMQMGMEEGGIDPDDPSTYGAGAPGEEAAPEEVKPTVQNTAPDDAPIIKVFKGKGGEGLQSALAKNRDALGIAQQDVAVIIKSVEQWAQTNQIKVENVSADVFNTIISEISLKYKIRRLQEAVRKLKDV